MVRKPNGDQVENIKSGIIYFDKAGGFYQENAKPGENDYLQRLASVQSDKGKALTMLANLPGVNFIQAMQEANECYSSALKIYSHGDFGVNVARIRSYEGNWWSMMAQAGILPTLEKQQCLEVALECYGESLKTYFENGMVFDVAWMKLSKAMVHMLMGDFESSLPLIEDSIQGFEQVGQNGYSQRAKELYNDILRDVSL